MVEPKPVYLYEFRQISSMNKDQLGKYVKDHFLEGFKVNLAEPIETVRKIVYDEARRLFGIQKRTALEPGANEDTLVDAPPENPILEGDDSEPVSMTRAELKKLIQDKEEIARGRGLSAEELRKCFAADGITPLFLKSKVNGCVFDSNPHMLERLGSEFTACDQRGNSIDASSFESILDNRNKRRKEVSDYANELLD